MNEFLDNIFESKWFNRVLHVSLLTGSAFIVSNPEYAWLVPVVQVVGQGIQPPK
jgi:hypothetical protein